MDSRSDKPEQTDTEKVMRQFELEMIQQRLARQQTVANYRGFRTASFMFLAVIIVAAALAFFYVFFLGGLDRARARHSPEAKPNTTELPEP